MLSFENDYSEGAHSRILKRLVSTDLQQVTGYGNDPFCEEARIRIRQAIGVPDADIYFLSGGTQTNQVVIDHWGTVRGVSQITCGSVRKMQQRQQTLSNFGPFTRQRQP